MYVSQAYESALVILITFTDSESWRESSALGKQLDKYFPIKNRKGKEPAQNSTAA